MNRENGIKFLENLEEALKIGMLDPSLNITCDHLTNVNVDVSNVRLKMSLLVDYEETSVPSIPQIITLADKEANAYDELLNEYIGQECRQETGLDVVEFSASINHFKKTKHEVEVLQTSYNDTVRSICIVTQLMNGEEERHDEDKLAKLEGELVALNKLADSEYNKLMELKYGVNERISKES